MCLQYLFFLFLVYLLFSPPKSMYTEAGGAWGSSTATSQQTLTEFHYR